MYSLPHNEDPPHGRGNVNRIKSNFNNTRNTQVAGNLQLDQQLVAPTDWRSSLHGSTRGLENAYNFVSTHLFLDSGSTCLLTSVAETLRCFPMGRAVEFAIGYHVSKSLHTSKISLLHLYSSVTECFDIDQAFFRVFQPY